MIGYWLTYALLALAVLFILAAIVVGRDLSRQRNGYQPIGKAIDLSKIKPSPENKTAIRASINQMRG